MTPSGAGLVRIAPQREFHPHPKHQVARQPYLGSDPSPPLNLNNYEVSDQILSLRFRKHIIMDLSGAGLV